MIRRPGYYTRSMTSIVAPSQEGALRRARLAAGLGQTELAKRAGISRQALGAIESGAYQPGVMVALKLSRELGKSVEELFASEEGATLVSAIWTGPSRRGAAAAGARVALGRVAGRLVATPQPVPAFGLAPAAGLVTRASGRRVSVEAFRSASEIDSTLLVAGCDPGVTILADWMVRHRSGVGLVTIPCSSRAALEGLREGRVHVAGIHMRDPRTGEYNVGPARALLGGRRVAFVNFARWEIGLCIHPRKTEIVHGVEDLAHRKVRIVNRERGSGARLALDEALEKVGLDSRRVAGYKRELGGHLEVAAAVSAGEAEAGVTIRVAAEAYGLGFLPLREERYDLVIPAAELGWAPVRAMLDALNSSRFGRELRGLCVYDTSRTGSVLEGPSTVRRSAAGALQD